MTGSDVTIVGNLARDPELRFTPGGLAVANFSLAVNRKWQNRITQEWEESVSFFDVQAWRELAENISESVGKGQRLIVTGRLQQRSWENEDGAKRYATEIVADDVGPSLRWATCQVAKNERRELGQPTANEPSRSTVNEPSSDAPRSYEEEPF